MVKKIIWSPLALETFDLVVEYLLFNFGEAAVKKFVSGVDQRLELIKSRPKMFRPTGKRRNTFITSFNKKVTLTYRFKPYKKQIELVVFWGKQDPQKKPQ